MFKHDYSNGMVYNFISYDDIMAKRQATQSDNVVVTNLPDNDPKVKV